MNAARVAPLLLLFAANLGAETSVYQCTTPDGAIEFRQRPCDEGSNGQRLEEVNWKLKRGYKASQGNKLRRKRRVYEDYISQLCK